MPKTNCDYSRTVIYKIVCNDLNITDCYVGHTTDFTKRKGQHKCHCNNENNKDYNSYIYLIIRENGGWDNWSMLEIEKFICNDGNEARTRERYWCEQLNSTLNSIKPIRSKEEKQIYQQQYKIEYTNLNKISIKENNKIYISNNHDKISSTRREYYNAHKIETLEKAKIKLTCICGTIHRSGDKSQHNKTKKHIDYINSLV